MASTARSYLDAAKLDRPRRGCTRPTRRSTLAQEDDHTQVRRRRSRRTSAWASIPATPTRWSAARSCCPHGTGKVVRVAVFAQGEKAQEALRAGADEVGAEDLVKKIEAGWLEFDVALAAPDIMGRSVDWAGSSAGAA